MRILADDLVISPAGSRAASFEVPVTLDMGDGSAELGLTDTIGTVS